LNRFYLKKPNRNRSVWLGFGFFFQKKNSVWLLFLIKTEPNRKWSPLVIGDKPVTFRCHPPPIKKKDTEKNQMRRRKLILHH
jgi:hypothetical protein